MPRKMKNPAVIAAHVAKVSGCELAPFVACCGGHCATEVHHVLRGANRVDAPWNIVSVCKAAHDMMHRDTAGGMVLCWWVIHLRGELDIDAIHQQWGRNPLARIEEVDKGLVDGRKYLARKLLEVYGG